MSLYTFTLQRPVEEVQKLAFENEGSHDNTLHMYLGACGDKMVRRYLCLIYPGTDCQQYVDKARKVLQVVWSSGRRWVPEGDRYALSALFESQQWDMSPELVPSMGDHRRVWEPPFLISPIENIALDNYLMNTPGPLACLKSNCWPWSIHTSVDSLCITGYTGLDLTLDTDDEMKALNDLISHHPTLTSLRLRSKVDDVWSTWCKLNFCHLLCVSLDVYQTRANLNMLCAPLMSCCMLDTLYICLRLQELTCSSDENSPWDEFRKLVKDDYVEDTSGDE